MNKSKKILLIWLSCLWMLLPQLASGAFKYKETAVSNGGSFVGKIILKGKAPAPKSKPVNKDVEICGKEKRVYDVTQVGAGGALSDAVAYIEDIKEGKNWEKDMTEKFTLDQKGCKFLPKSYVVKKGGSIEVFNKDPVAHNIHSYETKGRARITMFNSGQPAETNFTKSLRMRRKGAHGIKLECDAHNFMHNWMFAADNPYYQITATDGKFSIDNIPPGKYKVGAWHPALGIVTATIEIKAGGKVTKDLVFKK